MNQQTVLAAARLQSRLRNSYLNWKSRQIELALDLLLKKPTSPQPAERQVQNAMREASRQLVARDRLMRRYHQRQLDLEKLKPSSSSTLGTLEHELRDFLKHDVDRNDRTLLQIVMDGGTAETIAAQLGTSVKAARERLSRARTRALQLWRS